MGFQVSPGVNVTEIDLTTIVPAISTTDVAFAGVFQWGPLEDIVLLGNEIQLVDRFGKPDNDTATSFFTAANVLAYGDKLRLVRVANQSSEDTPITIDNTGGTTITGTLFTDVLRVGSVIDDGVEQRTVTEVTSATDAEIDSAFSTTGAAVPVTVTTYVGALNATSKLLTAGLPIENNQGLLIKNDDHYDASYRNGQADSGPWAAKHPGKIGNSLQVSVCPSVDAFEKVLTGTVASDAGTTLTGTGTSFALEVEVGDFILDSASGQVRQVTEVTSATSLELDAQFSPTLSGATVTKRWQFADDIGTEPGTSPHVATRGGSEDELHVVVVDKDGKFSNIPGTVLERHSFLSKAIDAKGETGESIYYVERINADSDYIRWLDHPPASNYGSVSDGVDFDAAEKAETVDLEGGRDGNTGSALTAAKIAGFSLFADSEAVDVSIVCLGEANTAVAIHVINNICETRKDCVCVISPEKADVVNNSGDERDDVIQFRNTLPSSSYAIMDSGWKYQFDAYNDVYRWIPLNGDIAGLMVRTDIENDPWYSPGGYNRGLIKNSIKLAWSPFKAERDDLYLKGINPVITQSGLGTLLFGDKTLLARPSAFDRINVRRLFIVLEKSIATAAKFMLFEFNDEFTRADFRNLVEPFLRDVKGRRGIQDFRVVCDSTNNTPEVIDRNEFVGDIYIKPARSINFIQLNFVAVRTGVEFSEIVGRF